MNLDTDMMLSLENVVLDKCRFHVEDTIILCLAVIIFSLVTFAVGFLLITLIKSAGKHI
jgi:hypothetical protein